MMGPLIFYGGDNNPYFQWASFSPIHSLEGEHYRGPSEWEACRADVKNTFARFLGRPESKDQVYLDHNATSCLQRIMTCIRSQVRRKDCVLLTTDAEFPGIMAMLDEQWQGPIFVVALAKAIAAGDTSAEEILRSAVDLVWPDVILFSHVTREAGFRITDETIRALRVACPEAVIVLDGSQSCGNVFISPELLDTVDFFVTSAHKWLMGKQTLGLTFVKDSYKDIIIDPAQSYARCRGNGGTGDIDSLRTCIHWLGKLADRGVNARHLDERNHLLTKPLLECFAGKDGRESVISWGTSDAKHRTGIVTVRYPAGTDSPLSAASTPIRVEPWRSLGEGLPSLSGRRYKIFSQGSKLRTADFHVSRDLAGIVCFEGTEAVRLCVHVTHSDSNILNLINGIPSGQASLY